MWIERLLQWRCRSSEAVCVEEGCVSSVAVWAVCCRRESSEGIAGEAAACEAAKVEKALGLQMERGARVRRGASQQYPFT